MKKMMLVPPQGIPSPLLTKLTRLDQEMKDILQRHDLEEQEKLTAYSQVLSRYLDTKMQYQKPTAIPFVEKQETSHSLPLTNIPVTYQRKAELLAEHIEKTPEIAWNSRS